MTMDDPNPVDPLDKIYAVLPGRWDWDALRAGGAISLFFAVPVTLIAAIIDSDNGLLTALFFFVPLFGFVLGSGCAAWVQRCGTPLSHGVVCASVAYLVAQAVFITLRLVRGESVQWFGVFFTLGVVGLAGLFGGVLGSRLQARGIRPSSRAARTDRSGGGS